MRTLALVLSSLLLSSTAVAAEAPTVAVLYFDYQGKNEEMGVLKKGLAQMLISDLSANPAYRIVERDRLQEVLAELDLAKSKKIDKKSAAKVGKLLGARYLVLGGYFDAFGTLRVDARVVETETGKVLKSVGGHAKPDEFITLEGKLAEDLEQILSTQLSAKVIKRSKKRKRPKKFGTKTALRYAKALDAKDKGDKAKAKAELKKIVKEQPDFQIAQVDLKSLMK